MAMRRQERRAASAGTRATAAPSLTAKAPQASVGRARPRHPDHNWTTAASAGGERAHWAQQQQQQPHSGGKFSTTAASRATPSASARC